MKALSNLTDEHQLLAPDRSYQLFYSKGRYATLSNSRKYQSAELQAWTLSESETLFPFSAIITLFGRHSAVASA